MSRRDAQPTQTQLALPIRQARVGRLEWIGLAPRPKAPIHTPSAARITRKQGLVGDHHTGGLRKKRQISLIQAEHLQVVARLLGETQLSPARMRRNLVVSGINLIALKKKRFWIGEVQLEGTGPCAPCTIMETTLGRGGLDAMQGHGGILARVIQGGEIQVGDRVGLQAPDPRPALPTR